MDKWCPTCKTMQPISNFGKDCTRKDGLRVQCKSCISAYEASRKEIRATKRKQQRSSVENMPSQEIQKAISCDFSTGILYDNVTGTPLQTKLSPRKYLYVRYSGVSFRVHRLVWYLAHGEWPDYIDHIDGDTCNNKLDNLRSCNNAENSCNKYTHRDGKLVGCYFAKALNKWSVQFTYQGHRMYLGLYDTEYEASLQYCRYVLKHGLVRREFLPEIFTDEELYN